MTSTNQAAPEDLTEQHRSQRKKSVLLAVLTSLLSKGGNLALMAIAFPLGKQVLGLGLFGLFSMLQSFLFVVGMTDFGIGAVLTRRLSHAMAFQEVAEQKRLISTGFFVLLVTASIFVVVASVAFHQIPLEVLFGGVAAAHEPEFRSALWVCMVLFLSLYLLSAWARWQDAAQRTYYYSKLGAAGNFVALAVFYFGIRRFPDLWFMALALWGPQVLALLLNAWNALSREPASRPRLADFSPKLAFRFLREGLALFIILTASPIVLREGIRTILAHVADEGTLAKISILLQLGFYCWGFFMMLALPLTPALTEAVARKDMTWVWRVHRKTERLLPLALLICPAGFALVGPWLVEVWMGKDISFTWQSMAAYGLFFATTMWSGAHGMFYSASGCLKRGAWLMALECILGLVVAWLGIHFYGMTGGVLGAGLACIVTGVLHYTLLRRHLQSLSSSNA
jgi:O-antigen/teichoic acid export membrane protein